jgi:hypothetical protein
LLILTENENGRQTSTQYSEENSDYTPWALLKATVLFKLYYRFGPFFWFMAGPQLVFLKGKAEVMREKVPLAIVVPELYAALRSNMKFIQATTNRLLTRMNELSSWEAEEEISEKMRFMINR